MCSHLRTKCTPPRILYSVTGEPSHHPDQEVTSFWRTPVTKLLPVTKTWSYGSKVSKTLTLKHMLCLNRDCLQKALNGWVLVGSDTPWSRPWPVDPLSGGWVLRERRAQLTEEDWCHVPLTKTALLQREGGEEEPRLKPALTHISLWPER